MSRLCNIFKKVLVAAIGVGAVIGIASGIDAQCEKKVTSKAVAGEWVESDTFKGVSYNCLKKYRTLNEQYTEFQYSYIAPENITPCFFESETRTLNRTYVDIVYDSTIVWTRYHKQRLNRDYASLVNPAPMMKGENDITPGYTDNMGRNIRIGLMYEETFTIEAIKEALRVRENIGIRLITNKLYSIYQFTLNIKSIIVHTFDEEAFAWNLTEYPNIDIHHYYEYTGYDINEKL